jgi:ribose transport system permease protein
VLLLLAAAETFVIISGGIDLSVGMITGFTAVLSSKIMQIMHQTDIAQGTSNLIRSLVGLAACILLDLISDLLITRYRVPPFIAALGMWGVTLRVQLKISGGTRLPFYHPN